MMRIYIFMFTMYCVKNSESVHKKWHVMKHFF